MATQARSVCSLAETFAGAREHRDYQGEFWSNTGAGCAVGKPPTLYQRLNALATLPDDSVAPLGGPSITGDYDSNHRRASEAALRSHPLYPELAAVLHEHRSQLTPGQPASSRQAIRTASGGMDDVEGSLSVWQQRLGQLDQSLRKVGIDPTDSKAEISVLDNNPFVDNPKLSELYVRRVTEASRVYHGLMADYEKLQEVFMSHAASMFRHHGSILPLSQYDLDKMIRAVHTRLIPALCQIKEECLKTMAAIEKQVEGEAVSRKKRTNFSKEALALLNEFFIANINNPYPTEQMKEELAEQCKMTVLQVSNWFGNKRIRFKKSVTSRIQDADSTDTEDASDSSSMAGVRHTGISSADRCNSLLSLPSSIPDTAAEEHQDYREPGQRKRTGVSAAVALPTDVSLAEPPPPPPPPDSTTSALSRSVTTTTTGMNNTMTAAGASQQHAGERQHPAGYQHSVPPSGGFADVHSAAPGLVDAVSRNTHAASHSSLPRRSRRQDRTRSAQQQLPDCEEAATGDPAEDEIYTPTPPKKKRKASTAAAAAPGCSPTGIAKRRRTGGRK
eukprot:scpid75655/ scgid4187/ Pre-B-cell leukemia transcription factor 3; Homeobox protein PBX3